MRVEESLAIFNVALVSMSKPKGVKLTRVTSDKSRSMCLVT